MGRLVRGEFERKGDNECRLLIIPVCLGRRWDPGRECGAKISTGV